jgi:hypothetical protein
MPAACIARVARDWISREGCEVRISASAVAAPCWPLLALPARRFNAQTVQSGDGQFDQKLRDYSRLGGIGRQGSSPIDNGHVIEVGYERGRRSS